MKARVGKNVETLILSSVLAWLWFSTTILHIVFSASGEYTGRVWELLEKAVLLSNFLLFAVNGLMNVTRDSPAGIGVVPFAAQFMFWWGIGYLFLKGFRSLRRPSSAAL